MTTYPEFEKSLSRLCETLREAGLSESKIEPIAQRWLQAASAAELEEVVNALEQIADEGQATEKFDETIQLMDRIKEIVERPAMHGLLTNQVHQPDSAPKYPNIRVQLSDLDEKLGPIVRRASYAMSDAGIDQTEVEQYEREVNANSDPVSISRRWVSVS
jgi:hypothetical protein